MESPPRKIERRIVAEKGFTLVELMIVVAIIIILAILSLFGASKFKSRARGATCASNLRQIGSAILAYAVDNNGQLPPLEDRTAEGDKLKGIWPRIVADGGYLSMVRNSKGELGCGAGVWACPDCTTVQRNFNGYGVAEGTVMKVERGSRPGINSMRLAAISDPSRTWLVGDAAKNPNDLKTGWYAVWANPNQWKNAHSPAARHGGKVNVCMVDGHVEAFTMPELMNKDLTLFKLRGNPAR